MFALLLAVTLLVALSVSVGVAFAFHRPVQRILARLVAEELSSAWERYLRFAVVVVGVAGGVNVRSLERYLAASSKDQIPLVLTSERWTLEVYQALIGALQAVAWLLLLFFVAALIAYVLVRGREARAGGSQAG